MSDEACSTPASRTDRAGETSGWAVGFILFAAIMTRFRAWTAARHPELDAAVERAAAAVGEQVRGNIGDRDHLRYLGRDYDLIEAPGRLRQLADLHRHPHQA